MFTSFLHLITRRRPPVAAYENAFVKEVNVRFKTARNPRVERVFIVCWVLIALKCWLMSWLIDRYDVPIDVWWIIAPTLIFALLCTVVYFARD